uniref:Uncharacterized protein n=1 Tax=Caenorhabditis japonica TaxID=281687 RepID=A0A8R1E022_CAEJA
MCRWFSVFVLQYVVYLISAQEGKNFVLTRAVHPRRHKRAEQGRPTVFVPNPFLTKEYDPKCMVNNRDMMSCPKKNASDVNEVTKCIEVIELCDDTRDCPNGEDEDPHFCMFKKLEDAEIARIQNEIRLLTQNSARQHQFKDVIVLNDDKESTTLEPLESAGQPGIFKNPIGSDPFSKLRAMGRFADDDEDDEDDDDSDDDDEESEENEQPVRKPPAKKLKRSYRHLLHLLAARL